MTFNQSIWTEVAAHIGPALVQLSEKITAYSAGQNENVSLATEISQDFRTIQQLALRVKSITITNNAERVIHKKIDDTVSYLQQSSAIFRTKQSTFLNSRV
jgi:hypothetical protein